MYSADSSIATYYRSTSTRNASCRCPPVRADKDKECETIIACGLTNLKVLSGILHFYVGAKHNLNGSISRGAYAWTRRRTEEPKQSYAAYFLVPLSLWVRRLTDGQARLEELLFIHDEFVYILFLFSRSVFSFPLCIGIQLKRNGAHIM